MIIGVWIIHRLTIKRAAKAIITDYQGRYLFQLRDDISTITFPRYWDFLEGHRKHGDSYPIYKARTL